MAVLVAVVSCSNVVLGEVSTTTTSTAQPSTTSTIPAITTTSRPRSVGGYLVKYDVESLRPVADLEPIPMGINSWTISSEDGDWMLILEYVANTVGKMVAVDVSNWEVAGIHNGLRHSARLIDDAMLYMYDDKSGEVSSLDFRSGRRTHLGDWPTGLWMWDELQVSSDGRLLALGTKAARSPGPAPYSLLWLDPGTGETGEIEIGPIERTDAETGVFDGDYEIPETDIPQVAWGSDRLFIAHADGPEVKVVDLETGEVATHLMDSTAWLDRLLAFLVPTASAKGPSLGTFSSAALSPDGRFLFISGNRFEFAEGPHGSLVEESTHLGLTVIDTETWQVVDQPDLPFQFVRESGGVVFGVDTRSTSPWIDDVYSVSIDDEGVVSHTGPFTVEGGGCNSVIGGSRVVCSSFSDAGQSLRVVDLPTGAIIAGLDVGHEDYLQENGVLQDWSPSIGFDR